MSLNSSTWHSGEGAGVGGGRREFEPGQEQGIDGAEGCCAVAHHHHHHHHVTQSSHSINAIGPAPLWIGRKREHCSIMFATIAQWLSGGGLLRACVRSQD
jgi:hypothetical protein